MLSGMETTPFDIAIAWIFSAEGGYSDDAADRGGKTKFGISQRAYPDLDIAALTIAQAHDIYRRDYWHAARCGEMPPVVALTLFDARVNHSPRAAVHLVQQALGVTNDGLIGPETIAATHRADPEHYQIEYLGRRARLYARLAAADYTQERFLRGWFNRLFKLQRYIQSELPQLHTSTGGSREHTT